VRATPRGRLRVGVCLIGIAITGMLAGMEVSPHGRL
jgi:hypothetical protein